MSAAGYEQLAEHRGHEIECITYGEENAAVECVTCGCVLVDYDKEAEE